MGQTVYVDLLFMINFSMDFLCFFLTARILCLPMSLPRTLLASAIGGIYSDLALFMALGTLPSLLIDILVCVAICGIAFLKKGALSSLPLYIIVYFAISMALGGFMTAIFNLLNKADLPLESGASDGISVWGFALLAAVSGLLTFFGGKFFRRRSAETRAEIEIFYSGKSARLSAMTDTGNLLREPISGKPCVVADISALSGILPIGLIRAARERKMSALGALSQSDSKNVRIIPIKTALGDGMLIALRAEKITVDVGRGARAIDAFVALSDIKKGAQGSEALLPSEILN